MARERTVLAWTRSALNVAGSGTLIARAAFAANLDAIGIACALATAVLAFTTWRHGRMLYRIRELPEEASQPQTVACGRLTAATLLIGAAATAVTIAI